MIILYHLIEKSDSPWKIFIDDLFLNKVNHTLNVSRERMKKSDLKKRAVGQTI